MRRSDAELGAMAIASQAWRLEGEHPERDRRRRPSVSGLARSGGYWRQVKALDVSDARAVLWSPPRGLLRAVVKALAEDATIKTRCAHHGHHRLGGSSALPHHAQLIQIGTGRAEGVI